MPSGRRPSQPYRIATYNVTSDSAGPWGTPGAWRWQSSGERDHEGDELGRLRSGDVAGWPPALRCSRSLPRRRNLGAHAQSSPTAAEIPDLVGVWDGGPRSRPVNGVNMPWTEENFPVLNERALAFQQVFDEALAPKYDCLPGDTARPDV